MSLKREFLANFKVGDQPLTAEIIDAIMAEYGRGIEAAKKPFADYDTIKNQLAEALKTIKGFEEQGMDMEAVRKSAKEWEDKYNQAVADHKAQMDDIAFHGVLDEVITNAKGKNAKAIKALLDLDALKKSNNQAADAKAAVDAVQKECGYLFGAEGTPPPYAGGTGNDPVLGDDTSKMTYSQLCAYMEANPGAKI